MPTNNPLNALAAFVVAVSAPFGAFAFEKVTTRNQFVEIVSGKDLKLTGITVNVTPGGQIKGRAYGFGVKGEWKWQNGYFCRSLFWGKKDLGPNCQEVKVHGNKIRFTSDKGTGQYADLTLR